VTSRGELAEHPAEIRKPPSDGYDAISVASLILHDVFLSPLKPKESDNVQ
jgi:hypothetical protein